MEIDAIASIIDAQHKDANEALEARDVKRYMNQFDDGLKYIKPDAVSLDKKQLTLDLEKHFKGIKAYTSSQYRIKSSFENGVFTEKIARKSIIIKPKLILLSKKQTIQTEEIYRWKNDSGEWKVVEVEVVLEEKY
ncbi:hypothetical protein DHW03_08850 [Pedobacter yonginense]|uniref:DUF4440 domain-containing protein n=1 Tax=Pedobacter yonginense TaxID=651869 RepID=A0A317EM98_9SPHI|nr:hypothetical protein [Pedobacter yonginense]PWS27682.1 hypothetical protein DHW03_08850 [Pedobacter yonginense]